MGLKSSGKYLNSVLNFRLMLYLYGCWNCSMPLFKVCPCTVARLVTEMLNYLMNATWPESDECNMAWTRPVPIQEICSTGRSHTEKYWHTDGLAHQHLGNKKHNGPIASLQDQFIIYGYINQNRLLSFSVQSWTIAVPPWVNLSWNCLRWCIWVLF